MNKLLITCVLIAFSFLGGLSQAQREWINPVVDDEVFPGTGEQDGRKLVVIGYAENLKAGATVLSIADSLRYSVEGIHSWEEVIVGKKVKVSGRLYIRRIDPSKPNEPEKQQMAGIIRTLRNPKWELVK